MTTFRMVELHRLATIAANPTRARKTPNILDNLGIEARKVARVLLHPTRIDSEASKTASVITTWTKRQLPRK